MTPAQPGQASPARWTTLHGRQLVAVLLGLAVLAFVVRLAGLAAGGGLDGRVGLDDGTYFAGAIAFANGRLPYLDFNILHPPGILYLLSPFALLANATSEPTGLVAARLVFMLLGAVNTLLVGLVGARVGKGTALWAAALYALWEVPLQGERSTLLVAPQVTAMLVALLALTGRSASELTTRRVAAAGVAIGVTGVFQIWAVVPATVILAWLVLRTRSSASQAIRLAVTYVVAGAATALIFLGPFLVIAGPRMIQMIIFAQGTRIGRYGTAPLVRLRELEGLATGPLGVQVPTAAVIAVAVAASALVLLAVVRRPETRLWAAIAIAELAFIMAMPLFISHYGAWPAPVIALSVGAGIACTVDLVPRGRRAIAIAAWGMVLLATASIGLQPTGSRMKVDADNPDLAGARCVIADEGYVAIRTETLIRSLRNGCRILPNPRSISHINNADRGGKSLSRENQDEFQAASVDYFTSADAVLFSQLDRDGLTDDTMASIRAAFDEEQKFGKVLVFRRNAP